MQADQINCLKLLEILDFGLALASRQGLPVLKRTKRCVFLDFPAFLIFVFSGEVMRGGLFLFYSGYAIPTHFRPMPEKTQKL